MRISKRVKIAFVSNNAWSIYNFRLDVIKTLLEDGHAITIITPFNAYVEKIIELGCEHIAIDFDNKSINPLTDIRFFLRLNSLYKKLQPDLIFHYVAKPNIYGTLAAKRNNIASVAIVTGLGFAFSRKNLLYAVVKLLYRFSLNGARDVLFLNNDDAQLFAREKIVPLKKINVLPGEGINTDYFAPQPSRENKKRFRFLMSCRMLKSKGVEIFVEAARLLKLKGHVFDAIILGFFEENHPDSIAPAVVESWQQDGLVNYLGFRDDVRPVLAEASAFVFPSFYNEGVPRSLLEAASMELPIITTHNKGCRDVVVDKVNGFLCKLEDPFDLASKMEEMLLMDPVARENMGQKGRELVRSKFGMEKVIHEYRRIVAQLDGC